MVGMLERTAMVYMLPQKPLLETAFSTGWTYGRDASANTPYGKFVVTEACGKARAQ
jgi:hypothetical protein